MKNKEKYDQSTTPAYLESTLGSKIFDCINVLILIVISLSCILPIWYTFCISISDKSVVAAGLVKLWPRKITVASYGQIINDKKFFVAFGNSIVRVLYATVISTVVSILTAYPLSKNRREFPARNVCMWILLFCMLFNGGLVPWFMTMKNLGMTNKIIGLALAGGVPIFNVILVMNFFRNLPKQMEEAAVVDGANPWKILVYITVPVSAPVIATVVLFTAVGHWNEFFQGLVLSSDGAHYPLQTYIQQLVVNINSASLTIEEFKILATMSNQTLNAAKLFVAMLPVLIVYPFLQKYFITGITLGSVKE